MNAICLQASLQLGENKINSERTEDSIIILTIGSTLLAIFKITLHQAHRRTNPRRSLITSKIEVSALLTIFVSLGGSFLAS
uniref:Uncharacterized protein n=1 Tax=Glossina palpalis gambiensis TaxID=67801 RepID=A0A1B0BJ96_9MUSC